MDGSAPRLFGITATEADVVAVLRRGPTDWAHVGRWDTRAGRYEAGSWLRGTLYPQRCDLSPDGRFLCYLALKGGAADWPAGRTYIAVSRLPWLTALVAWGTYGTWDRGAYFVEDRKAWCVGAPAVGDPAPLRERYGLVAPGFAGDSFAVERRRGWVETPDCPPRAAEDRWDERRAERIRVGRPRPLRHRSSGKPRGDGAGAVWLVAGGSYAAFRAVYSKPGTLSYELRDGAGGPVLCRLDDVQWADWSRDGRLLVATADGRLQVRDGKTLAVRWEHDVSGLQPDPQAPPPEAQQWC